MRRLEIPYNAQCCYSEAFFKETPSQERSIIVEKETVVLTIALS